MKALLRPAPYSHDSVEVQLYLSIKNPAQASEVASGLASSARVYLVKPFAPADLAETVATLLAEHP